MALPQKVIEQLGREPPKTPGWSGQLLMFSSTVLFISLLIYFGVAFGYQPYLESQVQKLNTQIQTFGQQIPLEKQAEIIKFYSQIANLKTILANHIISSPIFEWLEKNTQTNVYFTNATLNTSNNQLTLSGAAKTIDDVNQELAIFQSQPEVVKFSVGTISFTNSLWRFELALSLDPKYFSKSGSSTKP
ncbi:MAG: hypothetical protein Q7R94_01195 [bacterium]|nr:hypothetical protein [bacterium]